MTKQLLGLEGVFPECDIPAPMRRAGMAEWCGDHVRMLDRRLLPLEETYLQLRTYNEVATAIRDMAIQGAYSISIAAGYGLALAAYNNSENPSNAIDEAAKQLIATRPTGLAIKRMMQACLEVTKQAVQNDSPILSAILSKVDQAAIALAKQGYETGKNACDLLADGARILTHCFPDRSYVYLLMETARRGKQINIIASETRPYLQGARLTAYCALHTGFKAQIITDGMGGFLMREGKIDALVTAADRVCMDGTVCNKIGTYQYALAARENKIPYYALRQSGPDVESATETDIEVEYRDGDELLCWNGIRTAPLKSNGLYPAFDITPAELISKIITDRGVFDSNRISDYSNTPPVIKNSVV